MSTMSSEHRRATINGIEMSWHQLGPAGAPTVFLLHALGQSAGDWAPIDARLASAGYQVVAADFRGHAGTAFTREYSFEAMRDDIVALMDHLSVEHASLIGHSMGGTVAYLVTEGYPGRVDRLIIEDTPPPGGRGLGAQPTVRRGPAKFEPSADPFDVRLLGPIGRQLAEPDPAWWEALSGITCPVLLVGGGPESPIDQDSLAAVAHRVGDGVAVTLGGGHYVHANQPEQFGELVLEFLARPRHGL